MDEAFAALSGKDGPKISYEETWWESLPVVLQWAQEMLHGGGGDSS